jgi:hypothetical protein
LRRYVLLGSNGFAKSPPPENLFMQFQGVLPARIELLNAIDQQIEILMTKAFAGLTPEERSEFKNRQQRIRDLERQVAIAKANQICDAGVFAGIYK